MKFCQICGRPLNDGEVCTCQMQQAAPQQAPQQEPRQASQQPFRQQYQSQPPRQPQQQPYGAPGQQYPQQPGGAPRQQYPQQGGAPRQQYPQQPYGGPQQQMPPRPAQDSKFVKALKNIPIAFRSFFKNGDKVIATAKAKNDYLLPLLYVAIFFLVNLILSICFFARATGYNANRGTAYVQGLGDLTGVFGGINNFNFGLVLLAAFIMTIFITVLCVGLRFFAMVVFGKKPAGQAVIESFIEFGFHLIPVSCLILLAALLGLATAWLIVPLIGLAASYLLVIFITTTLKEAEGFQNKLLLTIILTVCVMLAVALSFLMLRVMCTMNYSYIPGNIYY